MSLQVRLRHALGERWIELPERGVDHPLIVGRAAAADVQVPSAAVAHRQCVLFVHDGHWVVQDVGAEPGTYVNGDKVQGPTFLRVGDIVALGGDSNAPVLEIDPNGPAEGRTGYAIGTAPEAAPAPAHNAQPQVPPDAPPPAAPFAAPVPGDAASPAGYVAPVAGQAWVPSPFAVDPTEAALLAAAASSRYSVPRRRPAAGGAGVVVAVALVVLALGGGGYWLYRRQQGVSQAVRPAPDTHATAMAATRPVPRNEDTSQLPPSMFESSQPRRGATRPATIPRPVTSPRRALRPVATAPVVSAPAATLKSDDPYAQMEAESDPVQPDDSTGSTTTQDPATTTPPSADVSAWKQVEAASFSKDEARAILLFDDYARTHPNVAADKIRDYTEKALDRIWFERLEQLAEQQEELNKKIQEVDRDLAQEPDEAYKKRVLTPLKQQYATRLGQVEDELANNMKYRATTVPNLLDDAELDKMRKSRDPQDYAAWKDRILNHIRRTHGGLPWVAGKSS